MTGRTSCAALKRFVIENLEDRKLVERAILLGVLRRQIPPADLPGFARFLFSATGLRDFFENLLVYLLTSGRDTIDDAWIGTAERVRQIYPAMMSWIRQTFVDGNPSLPPVSNTSGMVFISMLLDVAESDLLSIRALEHARAVSEMRCRIDEALRRRERLWILEAGFVRHVGHLVYAASLLQLQASGRLTGPTIAIATGETPNPYLLSRFRERLIATKPDDVQYVEMISARKRFRLADGSVLTMSEVVSEAARLWSTGAAFLALDEETKARGDASLAELGVPADAPVVTLHVRDAGYNQSFSSSMRLRDARVADYDAAIDWLAGRGVWVVRLGDRTMERVEPRPLFIDYPFTAVKSDWMDVYLAARCRFHIGTSSGMSFVPLLFGRPVLFTNWVTLAHMVCAPLVVTVPKVLVDRSGSVVPMAEYCDCHREILEASDAVLHGLSFRDNTPDELRDAVAFMEDAVAAGNGEPRFPSVAFADQQAMFQASPLRSAPQIPPAFWLAHYAIGGEVA